MALPLWIKRHCNFSCFRRIILWFFQRSSSKIPSASPYGGCCEHLLICKIAFVILPPFFSINSTTSYGHVGSAHSRTLMPQLSSALGHATCSRRDAMTWHRIAPYSGSWKALWWDSERPVRIIIHIAISQSFYTYQKYTTKCLFLMVGWELNLLIYQAQLRRKSSEG